MQVAWGGYLSDEDIGLGNYYLGPLLFLAYVNNIWRNIDSKIRLFADDCIIYRKVVSKHDVATLQADLDRLGDWAVENEMKINPSKSRGLSFIRA